MHWNAINLSKWVFLKLREKFDQFNQQLSNSSHKNVKAMIYDELMIRSLTSECFFFFGPIFECIQTGTKNGIHLWKKSIFFMCTFWLKRARAYAHAHVYVKLIFMNFLISIISFCFLIASFSILTLLAAHTQ